MTEENKRGRKPTNNNDINNQLLEELKKAQRQLDEQNERMQKMQQDSDTKIETLFKVADKRKLAQMTPDEERGTVCKISTFTDDNGVEKVVKSWKTLSNIVRASTSGIHEVDQRMLIVLEDGEDVEISLTDFLKDGLKKRQVPIIERRINKEGIFLTVEYFGKEYEINIKFIN